MSKTANSVNQDSQDTTTLTLSNTDSSTANSLMLAQLQACIKHFGKIAFEDDRKSDQIESLRKVNNSVQSELDEITREFLKYSKLFRSLEEQNESLLSQLHQTQESIEQYLPMDSQVATGQHRIKRILDRHPDYWDYESVDAYRISSEDDQEIVQWHFKDISLGNSYIPQFSFQTVISETEIGIIVQRDNTRTDGPLVRWPRGGPKTCDLPLLVQRHARSNKDSTLNTMGPTDWSAIQNLIARLAKLVGQSSDDGIWKNIATPKLREGLLAYAEILSNWPAVLRYDGIELRKITRLGDYTSLEIGLTNLWLGTQNWTKLTYRLASVTAPNQAFGENPRLEFPAEASQVFQTWFAETNDERGPRLELRFAHPAAMDTRVWNALNGHDQVLIAGLVASLRAQLIAISQFDSADNKTWQDWEAVADSIKSILTRQIAVPSQKNRPHAIPEGHSR
jgi:hypothetical protein